MRVVIDATPLALPPTGIGTYLRDTISACGPEAHTGASDSRILALCPAPCVPI